LTGTSGSQVSEKSEEQAPRLRIWIAKRAPRILFWTGLLLFWLACFYSAALPFAAILVGPALMLAGVFMMERNKRKTP
jgi:hypothetical protein